MYFCKSCIFQDPHLLGFAFVRICIGQDLHLSASAFGCLHLSLSCTSCCPAAGCLLKYTLSSNLGSSSHLPHGLRSTLHSSLNGHSHWGKRNTMQTTSSSHVLKTIITQQLDVSGQVARLPQTRHQKCKTSPDKTSEVHTLQHASQLVDPLVLGRHQCTVLDMHNIGHAISHKLIDGCVNFFLAILCRIG